MPIEKDWKIAAGTGGNPNMTFKGHTNKPKRKHDSVFMINTRLCDITWCMVSQNGNQFFFFLQFPGNYFFTFSQKLGQKGKTGVVLLIKSFQFDCNDFVWQSWIDYWFNRIRTMWSVRKCVFVEIAVTNASSLHLRSCSFFSEFSILFFIWIVVVLWNAGQEHMDIKVSFQFPSQYSRHNFWKTHGRIRQTTMLRWQT